MGLCEGVESSKLSEESCTDVWGKCLDEVVLELEYEMYGLSIAGVEGLRATLMASHEI